jgi:Protein of unknown function (DUF2971)
MPFYQLKYANDYLYHYTRAGTLLSKILPSRRLRMGAMTTTNDPRESKDWMFGFGTDATFDGVTGKQFSELEKEATTIAKNNCKVVCFTRDGPGGVGFEIDGIYDRGFCKPRMWAQYADNHTGVCLIFDLAKLRETVRASVPDTSVLYEGDVHYRNRSRAPSLADNPFILNFDAIRRSGLEVTVRDHVRHYWRELFFEKLRDWGDEKEYRWVLWDTQHDQHLFDFKDSLVAILLGPSFAASDKPAVGDFQKDLGFEVGVLNWKNGVPEVLPAFWGVP